MKTLRQLIEAHLVSHGWEFQDLIEEEGAQYWKKGKREIFIQKDNSFVCNYKDQLVTKIIPCSLFEFNPLFDYFITS